MELSLPKLEAIMKELGQLNLAFTQAVGIQYKCAAEMQCCLFEVIKKMHRAHKRFSDTNWGLHDIYVYDSYLHTKMKHKEEEVQS